MVDACAIHGRRTEIFSSGHGLQLPLQSVAVMLHRAEQDTIGALGPAQLGARRRVVPGQVVIDLPQQVLGQQPYIIGIVDHEVLVSA